MELTEDSVQGAAVDYVNDAEISEEARFSMGEEIGVPTNRMSDGTHISELQMRETRPVGKRGHKIEQSRARARATQQQSSRATAKASIRGSMAAKGAPPATMKTTPGTKGVATKRTKKQLRRLALKGSPATQVAGEECLEDLAMGRRSSALDRIQEAEVESEEESGSEGISASQQVAMDAIHFKKLEQKRKYKHT